MKSMIQIMARLSAGLVLMAPLLTVAGTSKARDLKWADNAAVKGAKFAALDEGKAFHRLPINLVLAGGDSARGVEAVVLLGSISVEIDGRIAGEYGPGACVVVPAGSKYTFTTTAAGECTFFLQHVSAPGSVAAASKARDLKWADNAAVKGAKLAPLGEGKAFHRLPINLVLAGDGATRGMEAVVLLGSISVEIDGRLTGEYGPGAYVAVPAGSKYTFTATAAGECTFFLQ